MENGAIAFSNSFIFDLFLKQLEISLVEKKVGAKLLKCM